MHASLQRLLDLGPMCSVFPGHEYTLQNLRFARTLEPDNEAVRGAMVEWQGHRGRNEPTVGTSLAREVDTNPFLRTSSRAIRERLGLDEGADAVTVLAAVREAKDSFR
jgi:hydroxyacylglutathione hydrolase